MDQSRQGDLARDGVPLRGKERRDAAQVGSPRQPAAESVRCLSWTCGHASPATAAVCLACGSPLRVVKDRSIAILLAFLFSFLTWTYTWKRDWWMFWIGLCLSLLGVVLSLKSVAAVLLPIGVWLWALVLSVRRTPEFYLRFPYADGWP